MKNKLLNIKEPAILFLLTSLLILILTNPQQSITICRNSSLIWWNNILPSLLPFMIISKCMIYTTVAETIGKILSYIVNPILKISNSCIYIIFVGLLCGFPMGSIAIENSISQNKISKDEAVYLLYFTNNISPAFFVGYILEKCPASNLVKLLFIQYGIPLVIAVILRYTLFKKALNLVYKTNMQKKMHSWKTKNTPSLLAVFPYTVKESIISLLTLLGTIMIFTVIQLPLHNAAFCISEKYQIVISALFEFCSGIEKISNYPALYPLLYTVILPFNGFSCMIQAYSLLNSNEIPFYPYILGKFLHVLIAVLCFW